MLKFSSGRLCYRLSQSITLRLVCPYKESFLCSIIRQINYQKERKGFNLEVGMTEHLKKDIKKMKIWTPKVAMLVLSYYFFLLFFYDLLFVFTLHSSYSSVYLLSSQSHSYKTLVPTGLSTSPTEFQPGSPGRGRESSGRQLSQRQTPI